jgi:hypothetical protein
MKIRISQSGGFAGVPIELANVDTSAVPPARAKRLEQLVTDVAFFDLPDHSEAGRRDIGADNSVRYSVTVERGAKSHTVSFEDGGGGLPRSAPRALGPLVREVLQG